MRKEDCPHTVELKDVIPRSDQCEECDSTSALRVCTTCGHVGCCESQQGHNTMHAREQNHPIIRSLPLSPRSFIWCYDCNDYLR